MTRAGTLRHLLTVEVLASPAVRNSDTGAITDGWSTFTTLWADIDPASGTEQTSAQKVTHQIKTRYVSGVLPGMRITKGTRIWRIVSVLNVGERDRDLLITAEETL